MLLKLVVLVLVDLARNLGLVHIGHLLPELVGLLILGFVFRFVYMFTDEEKGADYSGFWFFLETLIYGIFIGFLGLSMHPNEEHHLSILVRTQFRVLDFDFGRGAFIFYLSM